MVGQLFRSAIWVHFRNNLNNHSGGTLLHPNQCTRTRNQDAHPGGLPPAAQATRLDKYSLVHMSTILMYSLTVEECRKEKKEKKHQRECRYPCLRIDNSNSKTPTGRKEHPQPIML